MLTGLFEFYLKKYGGKSIALKKNKRRLSWLKLLIFDFIPK